MDNDTPLIDTSVASLDLNHLDSNHIIPKNADDPVDSLKKKLAPLSENLCTNFSNHATNVKMEQMECSWDNIEMVPDDLERASTKDEFLDHPVAVEDSGSIMDSFALIEILGNHSNGGDLGGFCCSLCSDPYQLQFEPPGNPQLIEARCACGYRIYMRDGAEWRQCIMQHVASHSLTGKQDLPCAPNIVCATCSRKLITTRFLDKARSRVIMSCSCGSRNYDREGHWWIRRGNTKQRKAPVVQCSDCGRRMWVHTWFDDLGTKVKMLCKCGYRNYSKQNNIWVRSPRWKRPVPHIVCSECSKKMYMSQWLNSEGTKVKMKCECGCKTLVSKNGLWVRSDWSQRLSELKLEKEPLHELKDYDSSFRKNKGIQTIKDKQISNEQYSTVKKSREGSSQMIFRYNSIADLVKEQLTGETSILDFLNLLSCLPTSTWFSDENSRLKAEKISMWAREFSDIIKDSSPVDAKRVQEVLKDCAQRLVVQFNEAGFLRSNLTFNVNSMPPESECDENTAGKQSGYTQEIQLSGHAILS
ncbi:hypothetical protein IE077_000312 [Cardiosporidium cionae]|uniref:Uncharacterized protein n=1 Tax=Cardiosporidium cionae TaxID=476202 RepID=A0ABQ7JBB5_9APIC|nr:hypothetical protein IE077_000312 [Cardiosporidium cionae]|eukprot:KAF8821292.1 hypothetical protein IE077_000312 [Cardiosporidium cionae]